MSSSVRCNFERLKIINSLTRYLQKTERGTRRPARVSMMVFCAVCATVRVGARTFFCATCETEVLLSDLDRFAQHPLAFQRRTFRSQSLPFPFTNSLHNFPLHLKCLLAFP